MILFYRCFGLITFISIFICFLSGILRIIPIVNILKKIMSENNNTMKVQKTGSASEVVQGIFQLKHLVLFTKCTSLCPSIEMYLKNDYPLILKYTVANLGEIKLVLALLRIKTGVDDTNKSCDFRKPQNKHFFDLAKSNSQFYLAECRCSLEQPRYSLVSQRPSFRYLRIL